MAIISKIFGALAAMIFFLVAASEGFFIACAWVMGLSAAFWSLFGIVKFLMWAFAASATVPQAPKPAFSKEAQDAAQPPSGV